MKTLFFIGSIVLFCVTFFGGIFFFHQDIESSWANAFIFGFINLTTGTFLFIATKKSAD